MRYTLRMEKRDCLYADLEAYYAERTEYNPRSVAPVSFLIFESGSLTEIVRVSGKIRHEFSDHDEE